VTFDNAPDSVHRQGTGLQSQPDRIRRRSWSTRIWQLGAFQQGAEAWTLFWQDQNEAEGCCAGSSEIQQPLSSHWSNFASSLGPGRNIIDLGCGNGSVGRALLAGNPALRIFGVDYAMVRSSNDPRVHILPGRSMEKLPFPGKSIDAAVSQFGFEYGQMEDCSRELARVLRPNSPISLLVHHSASRIAIDSLGHRQALAALSDEKIGDAFMSGKLPTLDVMLTAVRRQFPHERIVDEAASGLHRLIGQDRMHRVAIWRAMKAALAPELTMLADLERAAISPDQIANWLRPLAARFDLVPPEVMRMTNGLPLCWKIAGRLRPAARG
jgi:SAM-dependent methyltransferase